MNHQEIKPEEFVELLDKLILERLKQHLLQSSSSMNASLDKNMMLHGLDQRIQLIKSRLAGILRG